MVINGKEIAARVLAELKAKPGSMRSMVAILVGDDAASLSFLKQKEKTALALGIPFDLIRFLESLSEDELVSKIKEVGANPGVGGVLVQLPLPKKFDRAKVLAAIPPEKDVDGLVSEVLPPAVLTVKEILDHDGFDLAGKIVVVVGKGFLVGAPIAKWLEGKCRKVVVLDSKTGLGAVKDADLVITGTGKPGLIRTEMLKDPVLVIDFGYGLLDGKLSGDFDVKSLVVSHQSSVAYTPTPGGTGPILVAELFRNFYQLNK